MRDDWLNALQVIGTVVAAVAAVWALKQARDTVRETRAMRREERLARIPDLIEELAVRLGAAYGSTYETGGKRWLEAHFAREELRAAVAATGEQLPACGALMNPPLFPTTEEEHRAFLEKGNAREDLANAVSAAIDEFIARFFA